MKDAIIVLGDNLDSSGEDKFRISEFARQRVDKAVELYKKNPVPIIMSGRYWCLLEKAPSTTEAKEMSEYAVNSGIPESFVLLEEESMDTIGNAYFTKIRVLDPRAWSNLAVITSDFHIPRTQYVFEKICGPDYNLEFIAVPSKLSEQDLEIKAYFERELLNTLFKPLLNSIEPGDHEAAGQIIFKKLPGYSKNPEYDLDRLTNIILGKEKV